ncbi:hypothetical protein ABBQ38_006062 [Trebouxia sp. C0009 RCD-2024]
MLLRPQPFDIRQWHFALDKLACRLDSVAADPAKTAKAMRALVDFMATDKAHEGVSKNVTIYGQAFHNLDAFALVLQYAADKCIQIDFVAIAASCLDEHPAATEVDLASFATGLTDFDNASATYCPCVSLQFPCTTTTTQATTTLEQPLPSPEPSHCTQPHAQQGISAQPLHGQPPALDNLQHKAIVCRVVSEVAHLSSLLTPSRLCSWHGKPVQQPSAVSAQLPATCTVSGHTLTPAQLQYSDSMVQVGSSCTLTLPTCQAAGIMPPNTLPCLGKQAGPETPSLHIIKRLKSESVSESLVFGWPHILVPLADSFDSMREMQENEQSLLALCQVLEGQQEVLLLNGCLDMDTLQGSTWPLHYVARPAGNGCMLVRRVATAEELLPVNHLLQCDEVSDVPSHVQRPMQDALQALPLCDYSPLDHHSGALEKLADVVSQSLLRSSTPPHARPTSAPGQVQKPVHSEQAALMAPVKQKTAPEVELQQTAGNKVAAPPTQQAKSQATPAEHCQPKQGAQAVKAKTAVNDGQAGPRLNFKRIRTLK